MEHFLEGNSLEGRKFDRFMSLWSFAIKEVNDWKLKPTLYNNQSITIHSVYLL